MHLSRCKNATEPVKPRDCALVFAFPVTERAFLAEVGSNSKEFLGKYRYWGKYYTEFVWHYASVTSEISRLGTLVQCCLTTEQFANLFTEGKFRAITLFAHWKEEDLWDSYTGGSSVCPDPYDELQSAVEFFDRFERVPEVVRAVPSNFDGVLDLCVCHPKALVSALRRERPDCIVKYTNVSATPALWLYFYVSLFKLLAREETDYVSALFATLKRFSARGLSLTVSPGDERVRTT
ncbi:MAG TPA: hypothetical protein VJX67_16455 [Blastocatellia bacterium]|nr:hypothetical protein [Blastocatellia bacterium]